MTNLNLDRDEAIVLESEDVLRLKQDGDYDELDHVVLTNKRLYGSYEKGTGFFTKSNTEFYIWPLSDIKVINGQAQVQQVTCTGELCLRIQFMKETVYLAFSDDPEETMLQWILEINKLLGSNAIIPPPKPPKEKKRLFARKRTDPVESKRNATSTADDPVPKPSAEKVHTATMDYVVNHRSSPQHQQFETAQPPTGGFCVNCGNRLTAGTIFCPICGFKVTSTKDSVTAPPTPPAPPTSSVPPVPPIEEKVNRAVKPEKVEEQHDSDVSKKPTGTYTQRQQEFAGKIIKCPNCGEVLESFTSKCPSCGCEIRGRTAVASVKELFSNIQQAKNDKEIIRLIKTFPVPNSKEDILEFMVLASSNFSESYYVSHMGEDNISEAWLSKAEQCYQKAQLESVHTNKDML